MTWWSETKKLCLSESEKMLNTKKCHLLFAPLNVCQKKRLAIALLGVCVCQKVGLGSPLEAVIGSLETVQQDSAKEDQKLRQLETQLKKRLSSLNQRVLNAQKQLATNAKKFNEVVEKHNSCMKDFRNLSEKASSRFLSCQELSLMDQRRIQEFITHLATIKTALELDLPSAFRVSH